MSEETTTTEDTPVVESQPITEEQCRAFATHPKIIELNVKEMMRTQTRTVKEFMFQMADNMYFAKNIRLNEGQSDEVDSHVEFVSTLVDVLHEVTGEPIPSEDEVQATKLEGCAGECGDGCGCDHD